MFFGEQRILINSSFLFKFLPLSGFWIPLFMLLVSSIFWRWFFSVSWLISPFYYWIRRNLPVGPNFGYCFHLRPCFWLTFRVLLFTEISKCFLVFLIFSFCSRSVLLSTLWGPSRYLGYFHPVEWCLRLDWDLERLWWKLFILVNLDLSEIHKNNSGFWTSRPLGDDSLWPRWWHPLHSVVSVIIGGWAGTREHPVSRQSKLTRNTGS